MPLRPMMIPLVGKSGPLMCSMRSSSSASGLSSTQMAASMTSRRLWGGMLVVMPTAMPEEPFTRRLGKREGMTRGSFRDSSKLGSQSTVSFSMSRSISFAILAMRASV